ncbi:MAG: DUF456 domain-containing protein [Lentisphaeria bacterium]|jgi:uncharacterized protein YqgC (DUF456 family)
MLEFTIIFLAALCLVLGFLGCLLPALPGPPFAYAALLILHAGGVARFSLPELGLWLLLVLVVQALDFVIPMFGVKQFGGGRAGHWGCFFGTIIGVLFFSPWGIVIGPLLGAIIGEYLAGKRSNDAIVAGFGAFIGFLVGTILKFVLCGFFTLRFILALMGD